MGSAIRRSVKSQETRIKIITFTVSADGETVTGADKNNLTVTDTGTGVKTIELGSKGFADDDYQVQVALGTADTLVHVDITDANTFVVRTFDLADGTTPQDAICHITAIGKALA
jgi:hypothetical protein